MNELVPIVIPLLVVDILNPVLFALLIVAIGTNKPIANSSAFLAGHTFSYFITGILIALGLEQITDRIDNPHSIDFVIQLIIGLLLLWASLAARDGKASEERTPERQLTPTYCFGYGAVVNFIGVPFALPYFAVIDQVIKANLSIESSVLALAFYNAAYAFPFLLVSITFALVGDSCKPILDKINNMLISLVDKLMPIILFLLGAALTINALAFLIKGEKLW